MSVEIESYTFFFFKVKCRQWERLIFTFKVFRGANVSEHIWN